MHDMEEKCIFSCLSFLHEGNSRSSNAPSLNPKAKSERNTNNPLVISTLSLKMHYNLISSI